MRARSGGPAAAARTARASPARPEPRRRWRPRARGSRRNRWPPSASRWSGWSRPDPWFRCWPRRACCRRNRLAPGRVGNGLLPGGLTAADRLLRRVLGDRLLVRRGFVLKGRWMRHGDDVVAGIDEVDITGDRG